MLLTASIPILLFFSLSLSSSSSSSSSLLYTSISLISLMYFVCGCVGGRGVVGGGEREEREREREREREKEREREREVGPIPVCVCFFGTLPAILCVCVCLVKESTCVYRSELIRFSGRLVLLPICSAATLAAVSLTVSRSFTSVSRQFHASFTPVSFCCCCCCFLSEGSANSDIAAVT